MESAELTAILREVRDRVRARHPREAGTPAGAIQVPLPNLLPLVHARDAALGKVAAIGTVNPRRGGPLNALVQTWKKFVSRVLDWHVREQVEFNRHVIASLDAAIEAMNESGRTLSETVAQANQALAGFQARLDAFEARLSVADELTDISHHWAEWRRTWEEKLARNEIQFLRAVADLEGTFQHRVNVMDTAYREAVREQHAEFESALARGMDRTRLDFERLINTELRLIRQRAGNLETSGPAPLAPQPPATAAPSSFDAARFAERFRGDESYVRHSQAFYLPYFAACQNALDIGCGRGEFLEAMRDQGAKARGIDLDRESVALCRGKGLDAKRADLFAYLASLDEAALDGIFCAQVVEHIVPERLPEMIRLCASRLRTGAVMALETPNPECLAIFATHFYLDPTHVRPVPHHLLRFYLEEAGMGAIEVHKLSPALDTMPALASLPDDFREAFFGGLDYAIIARKL